MAVKVKKSVGRRREKIISYRFTCGNCGKRTDWYDSKIEYVDSVVKYGNDAKITVGEVMDLEKRVDENFIKKIMEFQAEIQHLHNRDFDTPFPFESLKLLKECFREVKECPHCGAIQPWKEVTFAYPLMWFFGVPVISSFIFGFLDSLDLLENIDAEVFKWLIVFTMIVMVPAYFYGKFRRKKQKEQYFLDVAKTLAATRVEIDWKL